MSKIILGISAYYHDSAAAIIKDNVIIAAAQEERFSRKKHDSNLPLQSINYCLEQCKINDINDVDGIVFYDKPVLKFMRIFENFLQQAPFGFPQFMKAIPVWLTKKLWTGEQIKKKLNYKKELLFSEHHISHASSAFFPSPFKKAAFLTLDGVGEWTTTSLGIGNENNLEILKEIHFPDSLGLLYSAFTYFCGFKVNSGEYKLMGLAPYGVPRFYDVLRANVIDIRDDGSFRLNQKYFTYISGLRMTGRAMEKLLGVKRRIPESEFSQVYMDVAASIQKITEEIVVLIARYTKKITGEKNLCLAGGVALNCVANGLLVRNNIFDNIWIQPAAGDAGGALGAALAVNHLHFKEKRSIKKGDGQKGSYLGPEYSNPDIFNAVKTLKLHAKKVQPKQRKEYGVQAIVEGKVLGWFQGKMEFGPRALGNRSILGDARNLEMQSRINLKIKYRESFRPFAPAVIDKKVEKYFDIKCTSPYMLLTAPVKGKKNLKKNKTLQGIDKLHIVRSNIPAVTHVDYSARIQTVARNTNADFYDLILHFEKKTGTPLLINTSFNVRGEPVVCTPRDALLCFLETEMDVLIIGDYVLKKIEQDQDVLNEYKKTGGKYALD